MSNLLNGVHDMLQKRKLRSTPYVNMDGFKVYYERIKE